LADFPESDSKLKPISAEQIPPEALWRLGAYYAPTLLILWTAMIIAVSFYRIDRGTHENNLRSLAKGAGAQTDNQKG
jgi:RsiW-degrading membrane proteinase PrsW (M82 family)